MAEAEKLTDELNSLATRIEELLNQTKNWAEVISVCSTYVEVIFNWDIDYGSFAITPNEDGGYTVEDSEYYAEKFDTIQQVVGYLVEKDNDNAR